MSKLDAIFTSKNPEKLMSSFMNGPTVRLKGMNEWKVRVR